MSAVVTMVECPSIALTVFRSTPAAKLGGCAMAQVVQLYRRQAGGLHGGGEPVGDVTGFDRCALRGR